MKTHLGKTCGLFVGLTPCAENLPEAHWAHALQFLVLELATCQRRGPPRCNSLLFVMH